MSDIEWWIEKQGADKMKHFDSKTNKQDSLKLQAILEDIECNTKDAEIARLKAANAELLEALKALLKGRPTEEPSVGYYPKEKSLAYRNWLLFEQARKAIQHAEER